MIRSILLCGLLVIVAQALRAQVNYTWNGATSTSWNTATNWTPNGIPGAADNVTVVTGGNTCKLGASTGINNLTLTSGTLDLNAGTLTVNGTTAQFTAGTTQNGTLTVTNATTTTFSPGPVTMNCVVNITSAAFTSRNTIFQNAVTITKTGATNDASAGGNTFNGTLTATNNGSGYLMFGNGNGDLFNAASTFINTGSNNLYVGYSGTPSTFNGQTTFTNSPSTNNGIYISWLTTGTAFNNNILLNSTSGAGIQFCGGSNTATAIQSAGYTTAIGASGFSAGTLLLRLFTQLGNTAINLNGTGTSVFYFGPYSNFGGTFTATAPDIWAQGATYNSAATFTKTGGSSNHNNQFQNIFNSTCTINQQSSTGYFMLGYNSNDQFNGNIIVNSTGSGGIYLGWTGGTGTPTLAAGKTVQVGAGGFSAGFLYLNTFTELGTAPINLTFSGVNTYLAIARNTVLGGPLTVTAPDLYFNGGTFNGTVTAVKNGTNTDYGSGGNTFTDSAYFTATGSGNLNFGNGNPDTWNSPVVFNSIGTGYIGPCWNSVGNQFNGNIVVTSTGTSQGIYFCQGSNTTTATLASGDTLKIGAAGFSSGTLSLRQFTQLGLTPTNLTLTGGTTLLSTGPTSTFGGDFTVVSPRILLNTTTFNDTTTLTKTGATGEWSNGGNTFNSTLVVNQQGSGYFGFANNAADIYNGDVYANNNSTERIIFGNNAAGGNQFNGNIIVTQIGSSVGIAFGWSGSTTVTQAANKTFTIGAAGFSTGYLQIERFTQLGNSSMSLNTGSSTTSITFGPASTINGNVTTNSGQILFNGCTFNGTVNSTKTGATNDWSNGGNIFNDTTTVTDAGSGYVAFSDVNPDQFNSVSTFNNTGSANMYVANSSSNNTFGGTTTFNNSPTANTLIYVSQSSTGTVFNGNIVVTSTNGQGVQFCTGNNTATATLSAGDTLEIGPAGFTSGTLNLKQFTQQGTAPSNLTLTGATTLLTTGPSSTFGGDFTAVSPRILLTSTTFNDTTVLTKTGATGEWMNGGNTFNSALTINMQGSGYFGWEGNNPDIFNGDVYANNNSTERIIFANNTGGGTQFNGNLILTQIGSSVGTALGWSASTNLTMAAGKTISIGAAGFSTGYLQIERFTQLGSTAMNLPLTGITSLTFGPNSAIGGDMTSTSGSLYFNGCTFSGVCNATKNGTTGDWSGGNNIFNGVTTITNAGSGVMVFGSGNSDQFNNTATFNNTGSNSMYVAYNSANNIFGGTATFNNTPTTNTGIYVSSYSAGTLFNGNIVVTSTNGQGVQFCTGNTTATATLASGNTISVGAGGFSVGYLYLRQFTQSGPTSQSLTLTGTSILQFGPTSAFGGNITTVSPTLLFDGCSFSGTVNSIKNGASNDASSGNNIFNGVTTITDAGAGAMYFGNGNADQFNNTATFNNTGSNNMYPAYNSSNNVFGGTTTFNSAPTANTGIYVSQYSAGTVFNGNIVATSTNGQGVIFCNGNTSATATLSPGYTISIGAGGFSTGTLWLRQFTQSGATVQSLTLTGAGNLTFGPSSAIGGNITTVSPTLLFNGCTFGGTVNSTKNGTSSDASIGNNTFNGAFTVTNTGTGYLLTGNGNPDTWNSTALFNNYSPANHMYIAYNSVGNTFNGDVTFNNQPGGTGDWIYANSFGVNTAYNGNIFVNNVGGAGVYFGNNTGTATLTNGSVSVGGSGFASGQLIFRNFSQVTSGATQTVTTTGTSTIQYGPGSSFSGPLNSTSPALLFDGCIFNGTVNAIKNGATNDQSTGNNTFNGTTTITNQNGAGYLMMTNNTADTYNGNITFVQSSTGKVYPNYNNNSSYNGNLTVTSPAGTSITFGAGNGIATFSGSGAQTISVSTTGLSAPIFTRLVINNSGAGVTPANTNINVSSTASFISGLLNTSATYMLVMLNGSSTAVGSALSTSYVNGPMQYQKSGAGATTLNFPIGTSADCRPASLVVNHANGTLYTYTATLYDADAQNLQWTVPITVDHVSAVHYWVINRADGSGTNQPTAGLSGNQQITLFFGTNDYVSNGATLTVCKNVYTAPTAWVDIGGTGGPVYSGGAPLTGSITSTSAPTAFTSFSTFTLGDKIGGMNVLPMTLLKFSAMPAGNVVDVQWTTATESNNSYFTVERSQDGANFDSIARVETLALGGNSATPLNYSTVDEHPYSGVSYYRLRTTDMAGNSTYSPVVPVDFTKKQNFTIYPNPSKGNLYVTGMDRNMTSVEAQWYDMSGKLLVQVLTPVQGGTANLSVNLQNGIYVLKLNFPDGSSSVQNIIILK
jgi:hypothetical protein